MQNGHRHICGKIGYASQVSWIYSETLKDNILFDRKFDPMWYETVIKACCLEPDIEMLPKGIITFLKIVLTRHKYFVT